MNEGIAFLRETCKFPTIRAARQAEGAEAARHRAKLMSAFVEVTVGVCKFEQATEKLRFQDGQINNRVINIRSIGIPYYMENLSPGTYAATLAYGWVED